MTKRKDGISLSPQNIRNAKGAAWYYENKGSIDVIVNTKDLPLVGRSSRDSCGMVSLRIPSSMLRKTLARQSVTKGGKQQ